MLIVELFLCHYYHASIILLAWLYVFNGIFVLCISLGAYLYYSSFAWPPDTRTWIYVRSLGQKLIPCFINQGILEINTFIDTMFASFLPSGTISLFSYSAQFMRVPLGVFATAFATISLPHLARISGYAPQRLSFNLLEFAKAIAWITLPAMMLMSFFSYNIFATILITERFSMSQAHEAGHLLIAASTGLFFFSMNRILLNIYYALHETFLPTIISLITAIANILLNFLLIHQFKAVGITIATSLAGVVQTILFLWFLKQKFKLSLYFKQFFMFMYHYSKQLTCVMGIFYLAYRALFYCLQQLHEPYQTFFIHNCGFWLWVGPLSLLMMGSLWSTRKLFNIKIYYFD